MITGYLIGLPHGPTGVALAYSTVMAAWAVPHIAWCVRGTPISLRDVLITFSRPLVSGVVAELPPLTLKLTMGHALPALVLLLLGIVLFLAGYAGMLLLVMGQKSLYFDLRRSIRSGRMPATKTAMASG